MPKTVVSNAAFLHALHKLKPRYRKVLLKHSDRHSIHCICECVYNTLRGNISLNRKQQTQLARHKTVLRKLVKPGDTWSKKKQLVIQSGGAFLPLLLAPILTGILSSLIKK